MALILDSDYLPKFYSSQASQWLLRKMLVLASFLYKSNLHLHWYPLLEFFWSTFGWPDIAIDNLKKPCAQICYAIGKPPCAQIRYRYCRAVKPPMVKPPTFSSFLRDVDTIAMVSLYTNLPRTRGIPLFN